MTSTIPYLTEDQKKALSNVIQQIAKEIKAERIICFGARTTQSAIWSSFLNSSDEARSLECDLLVLIQEKSKATRTEVSETVSRHNTASLKFNVLVHGIEAVNEELGRGNYFFSSILQKGVLLFDSEVISLNVSMQAILSATELETSWNRRYTLASNFFRGATYALSQGWNDLAMFMLHQAVEHTCIALIKTYWGYKATTHSLSKLLSMVENFSLHSITVFPRITKDEVRIFNQLEKAYSDSRYHDRYVVSTETVNALLAEVEEFLQLAQALFFKKAKPAKRSIEKVTVSTFESVGIDTFGRVILRQGDKEAVEIESEYGSEKSILLRNEDKRLWITTGEIKTDAIYDATVYVTYTGLSGVVVHHAESLKNEGTIETQWLGIVNNSRALIELHIDVLVLDVTLNKHGNVILSGSADEAKIFNSRTGEIDAKNLETSSAKVVIKGAGNVSVHVDEELDAELCGSGNLQLTGSPRIKRMTNTGTGTVTIIDKPKSYGKKESQEG